jgi:TolA-binding protein
MFLHSHSIRILSLWLLLMGMSVHASFAQSASSETKTSSAGNNATTSALLTRHQQRMDILEAGLKEIRGVLESDLREIGMKIQQLDSSAAQDDTSKSADMQMLNDKMERLTDMIAMTNRRMERTLEITSDTEFRLLRLEKRMQTLLSLGSDNLANAIIGQDTNPAKPRADVLMNRSQGSDGTTWTVDEQALADKMQENESVDNMTVSSVNDSAAVLMAESDQSGNSDQNDSMDNVTTTSAVGAGATGVGRDPAVTSQTDSLATDTSSKDMANANIVKGEEQPEEVVLPAKPVVLPDADPEEQYRFALGRALQNDLETAEAAFAEFKQFNKGHEREADAVYWLGRVQFMRKKYEKAAMTFSEFNGDFPGDARLVDTTMWIAESVSHFAAPEQACAIYESLPQLLDAPPEAFLKQLATLSATAKCGG